MSLRVAIFNVAGIQTAAPVNDGFESDASGWSAVGGGTIARDTTGPHTGVGTGLWSPGTATGTLECTFTGTFRKGVLYTLTFALSGGNTDTLEAQLGRGNVEFGRVVFGSTGNSTYTVQTIRWRPKQTYDASVILFRIFKLNASNLTYRVDSVTLDGKGAKLTHGYDVTDRVDNLQWSNVNPGGHERCSFSLKGSWRAGFPEVKRGNIVRVEDGGRECFTGRIDDQDPQMDQAEQVTVVAYGLGVRLKDDVMREIYVDRDLSKWVGPSISQQINGLNNAIDIEGTQVQTDETNGQPALSTTFQGAWGRSHRSEGWYAARGIPLDSIYYAWRRNPAVSNADGNWVWQVTLDDFDTGSGGLNATASLIAAGPGTGTLSASTVTRLFARVLLQYSAAAGTAGAIYAIHWTCLAVYGRHGLAKQGSEDATNCKGFFASQIVSDVCSRLPGLTARQIDTSNFVLQQVAFPDDTAHEDIIAEVSKYHAVNWGVWGPDQLIDPGADPTEAYLDWTARDTSTAEWLARRQDCDAVDLHTEIGTTYDAVVVVYTDPTGKPQRETRTIQSETIFDAAIATRTATLQGGTLTKSGAQQLGDAFLLLSSGNPVSRGRAVIKGSITNTRHGETPAHFLRADGSNIYIPDAFPDVDTLRFAPAADRRAIFPIKRVEVDCSGDVPQVTVELDQTNDLLSILLARLQLNAALTIGA